MRRSTRSRSTSLANTEALLADLTNATGCSNAGGRVLPNSAAAENREQPTAWASTRSPIREMPYEDDERLLAFYLSALPGQMNASKAWVCSHPLCC